MTLLETLQQSAKANGLAAFIQDGAVWLDGGITVVPEHLETFQLEAGPIRTATMTTARHSLFPAGLPEFQHSVGENEWASIETGFKSWLQSDYVALRAAVEDDDQACLRMEMQFPELAQPRQVIFGPTSWYGGQQASDDEHPFCPCCLLTHSIDAFLPRLKSTDFLGVRLYATRDADGVCAADCRINGHDFADALPYLTAYAEKWAGQGLEFRKQYVVIRNKA